MVTRNIRSGNADKRLTGRAGQELRARIRARDGYQCRMCSIAVMQGEVDHVIGLDHGGSSDDTNLQLLCHDCHRRKSAKDKGHRVRTGVDASGMPTDPNHHWS